MDKSIINFFLKHKNISIDTRTNIKNSIFFCIKGAKYNGNDFVNTAIKKGASLIIMDDEKKYKYIADKSKIILVNNSISTLQQLAKNYKKKINPLTICITGSNGKTTTKNLIHHVLKKKYLSHSTYKNFNNQIGVPLSILSMSEDTEILILELGANNFNEIYNLCELCEPDYGYITSFGKSHLENFHDLKGVIKAKTEIYKYLYKKNKIVIINFDDIIQVKESINIKNKIAFSNKIANIDECEHFFYFTKIKNHQEYVSIKFNDIIINSKLTGEYNINNIYAAISIGLSLNININLIKNAIENYIPDNNRSQILKLEKYQIILDCYNANPSSMEYAIKNLKNFKTKKSVILGDMLEIGKTSQQEHENIINLCIKEKISEIITVGPIFYNIKNEKIKKFYTIKNLVNYLNNNNIKHETILIKGSNKMKLYEVINYIK